MRTPTGALIDCVARGRGKRAVIGDDVYFEPNADTEMAEGLIVAVGPRRSALVRADAMRRRAQTLAANVDRIYVVCSILPPLREGLVDRYLVAAHAQGIESRVVFNKTDLIPDHAWPVIDEILDPYAAIGAKVFKTSAVSGEGLAALQAELAEGCSIFVGHSGVGKTSLLNTLLPELGEPVQALSDASGRGVHTTTTSSLYDLPGGGEIIDSPGVRSFGLWGIAPKEVRMHFPEFLPLMESCRFTNCQHIAEPQCAVKAALAEGEIPERRYESYRRIRESLLEQREGNRFF